MQYILFIIIAVLVLIICYLIPRHKIDVEIEQKNKQLSEEHIKLLNQQVEDVTALCEAKNELTQLEIETNALRKQKDSLHSDIETISAQASAAADEIYQKSYDLMQEKMSQSAEIASYRYQLAEQQHQDEYLSLLEENTKQFTQQISLKTAELQTIQETLGILKEKSHAAIEADKRRMLSEEEKDYYKIKISEDALNDIKILRRVIKELKCDPLPINKVIWEVYYKNPTAQLLGRLAPTGEAHIGIYKITNLATGQCYIGQSVDLRSRLRDHIKAGLGINSSNNKFYTEMKNIGPEQFMYEIIEECDKESLNERERYWINFYESTQWGFNTLQGNKD